MAVRLVMQVCVAAVAAGVLYSLYPMYFKSGFQVGGTPFWELLWAQP